ncbi:hypothetical protein G7Y89_g15288 [Cudoniella acicularis]|uniref:Heterokaryon incompatibility domain-containing protein n=1 Tax=Cudoniella acicularis TaxID=354080 RepID=A0A8H4QQY8_9HELO|nr:hypothetical protein G7Y89_g15288 [Cudoniella acicularis]
MASAIERPLYNYEPLPTPDTVRLVLLYPATDISKPVDFELVLQNRYSRVDKEPRYDAVSYAWGQEIFTRYVHCKPTGKYLKVTATVDSMLRHLRMQSDQPFPLWVDAICLNPADEKEKNIQVPLMGGIYHQARTVHIWLGDPDPDASAAFCILQTLSLQKMQSKWVIESIFSHAYGQHSPNVIYKLLHKAWFQRRWVIQEASLSHDTIVHCGMNSIRWPWFADGLKAVRKIQSEIELNQTALNAIHISNIIRPQAGTLLEILWDIHSAQCLDPRDHVFAIYGIACGLRNTLESSKNRKARKIVDYSRPWTYTYMHLAKYLIEEDQLIEVLRHLCSFGTLWDADRTLPSWVPNWSRARQKRGEIPKVIDLFDFPKVMTLYGKDTKYEALSFRGKSVGKVSSICGGFSNVLSMAQAAKHLISIVSDHGEDTFSQHCEMVQLLRTLCLCLSQDDSERSSLWTALNGGQVENEYLEFEEHEASLQLHDMILAIQALAYLSREVEDENDGLYIEGLKSFRKELLEETMTTLAEQSLQQLMPRPRPKDMMTSYITAVWLGRFQAENLGQFIGRN